MSSYHDVGKLPVGTEIAGTRVLEVTYQHERGTSLEDVKTGESFFAHVDDDPGSWGFSVTKPAPKQFKVGDKVSGSDISDLPVGTVVSSHKTRVVVKVADNSWRSTGDTFTFRDCHFTTPRTILHLP